MTRSAMAAERVPEAPFDPVAETYDATFTDTLLGRWLRDLVWRQLEELPVPAEARVLELGCGTGEDAAWLAARGFEVTATDASPRMLEVADYKLRQRGLESRARFLPWDLADSPPPALLDRSYDLVFSNFGALNCVPDRRALWASLARLTRPGGFLAVVFMGPFCLLETFGFALRGQWRAAGRRWRDGRAATIGSQTIRVWFPSAPRIRRELSAEYQSGSAVGIGTAVPPSHWAGFIDRHRRLFAAAQGIDRILAGNVGPWIADHYFFACQRRESKP